MSADFSQRPLAVGTLTGLRAFRTTSDGRLLGPVQGTEFVRGENVAVCEYRARAHQVGELDCTCGFYAYTTGENDWYFDGADDRIQAVVEGYGVCTVGSRGFRAEKARLVALVDPTPWRRTTSRFLFIWGLVWAPLDVAGGFIDLHADKVFGAIWMWLMALVVLLPVIGVPVGGGVPRKTFAAIRRAHPGVVVYRTLRAALKAHPLSATASAPCCDLHTVTCGSADVCCIRCTSAEEQQ